MKHRVRFAIRIAVLATIIAAVTVLAVGMTRGIGSLARFNLLRGLGIVRTTESRNATVLLERVRDMYRLDTVEMVYRTVFPYDYMDPTLDIGSIIAATRASRGSVASLLSPAQERYLRAYNLSRDLGMQTGPDRYDFVVVTAVVHAGIDLSDTTVAHPEAASKQEIAQWMKLDESNGAGRSVSVRLPQAVVTEVRIEDPDKATYAYPDVQIPPSGWKRITAFVASHIREDAERSDLRNLARERARTLVESFLKNTGFDTVDFVE
ncbi:MAG TPA: DUF4230 domain-containing protein [Spirochaetia bacterium]|nr:DUF4230 domain-containing protein [Spirochaetia bacterium]